MNAKVLCRTANLDRAGWLAARKAGVGGSEIAAVAGVSRYSNAAKVYHDKISDVIDTPENEAMYWGNKLEDVVAKEFAERTGMKIRKVNAILQHPEYPWMLANLDRLIVGKPEMILECKTAGAYAAKDWEGGATPDAYRLQVLWYMAVTGLQKAHIAALIGGQQFITREIERDEEIIGYLIKIGADFWQMVQDRQMPAVDGSDASTDLINLLYPVGTDNELLTLPDEAMLLCNTYQEASAAEKAAVARKKEASNALKALMGERVTAKAGDYTVRWSNVNTCRLDQEALKEEMPDVFNGFLKTSPSRRLTITTPKAAA